MEQNQSCEKLQNEVSKLQNELGWCKARLDVVKDTAVVRALGLAGYRWALPRISSM